VWTEVPQTTPMSVRLPQRSRIIASYCVGLPGSVEFSRLRHFGPANGNSARHSQLALAWLTAIRPNVSMANHLDSNQLNMPGQAAQPATLVSQSPWRHDFHDRVKSPAATIRPFVAAPKDDRVAGEAATAADGGNALTVLTQSPAKPYMLFLPDIDGVGATSARAWPSIAAHVELHILRLESHFNGHFQGLSDFVVVSLGDLQMGMSWSLVYLVCRIIRQPTRMSPSCRCDRELFTRARHHLVGFARVNITFVLLISFMLVMLVADNLSSCQHKIKVKHKIKLTRPGSPAP
jgi:hypothetical protein